MLNYEIEDYSQIPKDIQERIEKLENLRRQFIADVSHELRTPLTVFSGYLEVLLDQKDLPQETLVRIYRQMMQHTRRMEALVTDLLLLSQLENNKSILVQESLIDVNSILSEIIHSAYDLSGDKQHRFHLDIDNKLYLWGVERECKSLFSNLIFNAVKYSPARSEIIVSWHSDADKISFEVKDHGLGIEEEHIDRLTERFYRVTKDRSRDSGGTGLGLAIVKHVLIRHQGQLNITSKVGEGSTFRCFLPLERIRRVEDD